MTAELAGRVPLAADASLGSVVRRPGFLLLVLGQTISQLGDKLHHMALIALVGAGAQVETGGIELAKLSVVFTAPVVLFGPLAGALVDRWNKRAVMLVCDLLRTLVVCLIPWLYATTGHLWAVYAMAFLVFLLGIFFNSAKMALIPDLVERHQLLAANAALTSVGRVATVVGIVGGGMLIGLPVWRRLGWSDYAAGFYLDALSFLVSTLALLGIILLTAPAAPAATSRRRAVRGIRALAADVRESIRVIHHTPGLRFAFGSLILLGGFASTVYVAMTVSVQTVMGRGTAGVGILGGVLAAGMVLGSVVVGSVARSLSRTTVIESGIGVIGLLMLVGGTFFSYGVLLPVAFLGGAMLGPVMIAQDTLLHEHAPADARAVLFSTKDLLLAGVFAVSAFLVGGAVYLLGRVGVAEPYRWSLGAVGGVMLAALPVLRTIRPDQTHS
ncbi:MAG: MFS transporter [Gemmatimonadetes bacterium]|nr:MFS transporter [Gemmatimonadota bacterium]